MAKDFKEKTITVNLTKVFNKPVTKRAKSALFALKNAIRKETRIDNIKISNGVNEAVWARGLYHTPRKITVKLVKEKTDVRAYLPEEKIIAVEEKKTDKKTVETKTEVAKPKEEKKTESKATEHKTTEKKVEHKKESTKKTEKK